MNNEIVYWAMCATDEAANAITLVRTDGTRSVLAPLDYNPTAIVWDSIVGGGYISSGSGLCDGIARVDQTGVLPFDLVVGVAAQQFRVDDYFFSTLDCSQQGRATLPDLSRDGESLAFFASPLSVGGGEGDRLDIPWNLYTVDEPAQASDPTLVLSGILNPRGLRWSPDGMELAFAGEVDGQKGSWLFNISTSGLTRFSDVSLDWLAWSPDGRRIIGDDLVSTDPFLSRVLVFDLP